MKDKTIQQFVEELSSATPTPGGGSVAALVGALSGALGCMVANLTLAREPNAELEAWRNELKTLTAACLDDMQGDADAYLGVVTAQKLPKKTDADKQARTEALQAALKKAARAPMDCGTRTVRMLELAARIAPMARSSYVSDLGVANFLALASVMSSAINVETNVHAIHDPAFVKAMGQELAAMEARAHGLFGDVETGVKDRMAPTA